MVEGETRLEYWVKNEPVRAEAFFQVCGGNILLIEKFDFKKITEWGEFLFKKSFQKNVRDYFDFYLADKIDFDFDFENISDIDIDNSFKAIYESDPYEGSYWDIPFALDIFDI